MDASSAHAGTHGHANPQSEIPPSLSFGEASRNPQYGADCPECDYDAERRDHAERLAAALAMHGLLPRDLEDPAHAARSGGLTKVAAVISVLRYRDDLQHRALLRKLDAQIENNPQRERELLYMRRKEEAQADARRTQPAWQIFSGLDPRTECDLRRDDRRRRVAGLVNLVRELARYELNGERINHQDTKAQRTEGAGVLSLGASEIEPGAIPSPLGGEGDVSASERRGEGYCAVGTDIAEDNPHSEIPPSLSFGEASHSPHYLREPLHEICFYLGISRNRLSQYCKEHCGLAAHEVIDQLRAATLKENLRAKLTDWFAARVPSPLGGEGRDERSESGVRGECAATSDPTPRPVVRSRSRRPLPQGERENAVQLWHQYNQSRRAPEFHRGAWALELGFANYHRYYRACLIYYGLAPSQLELAIIEELLCEHAGIESSAVQHVHNFTGSAQKTSARQHWSEEEGGLTENNASAAPPPRLGAVGS